MIAPQSLARALSQLITERELQIIYSSELLASLQTRGAQGDLTTDEVLEQLLRGTGLSYRFVDAQTVAIVASVTDASDTRDRSASSRITNEAAFADQRTQRGPIDTITVSAAKLRSLELAADTGSRLGLSARQTPATLDVIDADQIVGRGLHTVQAAIETLPGVVTGGSPASPSAISMRGFPTNRVMVLFDGMYIGPSPFVNRPGNSFNLERVEALKGPASVLYGEGAIGGVINTVTRKPQYGVTQLDLLAGFGSRGAMNLGIGGNVAHGDTLAARADISRTASHGNVAHADSYSTDVTAAVRWRPSIDSPWDVLLQLQYFLDSPSSYFGTPLVPAAVAIEPMRDVVESIDGFTIDRRMRSANYNVGDHVVEAESLWPRLTVKWVPSESLTVENRLFYYEADRLWKNAETYSFDIASGRIDRDRFLISHDQKILADLLSVTWHGGLFGWRNTLVVGLDYNRLSFTRDRGYVPDVDSVERFAPVPGSFGEVPVNTSRTAWDKTAVFVENMLEFSPRLKLVIGGRLDAIDLDRGSFATRYRASTARIGLVYDATDALTPYISYASAADPPGTDLFVFPGAWAGFPLSRSWQAEAGVKGTIGQGQADFTVAAYRIERKDVLTQIDFRGNVANIGSQTANGLEVSGNVRITPRWTLSANGSYTSSRYDQFSSPLSGVEASGNFAPNVPRYIANIWTSVRDVFGLPLQIGGGVRAVGDRFADDANAVTLKRYALANLYTSYALSDRVLLTARATNLFDEDYANWADMFYPSQVMLGEPRRFELEVLARF